MEREMRERREVGREVRKLVEAVVVVVRVGEWRSGTVCVAGLVAAVVVVSSGCSLCLCSGPGAPSLGSGS